MTLQGIIFSKDRALQVHGTLSSFLARCKDASKARLAVIYKATSGAYAEGYSILKQEFSGLLDVEWVVEGHFKNDLTRLVPGIDGRSWLTNWFGRATPNAEDAIFFMVDDNLFVRDFHLNRVVEALDRFPRAIGFSLRVGRNTTYCYSNRCDQPLPDFENAGDGILRFEWPGQVGDFGYPLEVSSSVYRTKDLVRFLKNLPYSNPNRLEQGLSISSRLFVRSRPELMCFEQSVAFCAPMNIVQTVLDNRAGSADEYSTATLNRKFLEGWRINVESLKGFVPQAAHQEIELPLCRV